MGSVRGRLHKTGGQVGLFGKNLLVLVVVTDPIPKEGVVLEDSEGSIARADANRPNRSTLLESQRRVPRVSLPKPICRTGPALDIQR